MKTRKLLVFAAVLLAGGAVLALLWVRAAGEQTFLRGLADARPTYLAALLGITTVFIFVRFVRWQFLLRQVGPRIPARPSLSVYLASLVGTATPAYIGEAVLRGAFNRLRFGIGIPVTVWTVVLERTLDVLALALLGLLTASTVGSRATMAGFVLVSFLGLAALSAWAKRAGIRTSGIQRPHVFLQALLLSLAAWIPAALLPWLAGASLGEAIAPLASIGVFSNSTLLGGLTLMPAGVGSTGSLAILQLEGLGIPLTQAVLVITLVRLSSTGVVLVVGTLFAVREVLARRTPVVAQHFDEIAAEYSEQFRPHVWNYLLDRKVGFMTDHVRPAGGKGLDLGCGLGQQSVEMKRRGFDVVGLDIAVELLKHARANGVTVTQGSAWDLPFRDDAFAFAYTVGVLHHLPDAEHQAAACREVARVLRPGGYFLVHESNPRNPIFRFYMGYVFPLLKSIDEGVENWLEAERWQSTEGLELVDVVYFTFLPDFVPAFMMKPLRVLERALESSRWRPYSVHYMAVLRKTDADHSVPGSRAGAAAPMPRDGR